MKPSPRPGPEAAFPDGKREPEDAELAAVLGPSRVLLEAFLERLRHRCPEASSEWRFSPRSGWHRIISRGKRRLAYLIPARGNFRLSMVLGGKAIAALQAGPQAKAVAALLKEARRYPEGTAFSLDGRTLDIEVAAALVEAKIGSGS